LEYSKNNFTAEQLKAYALADLNMGHLVRWEPPKLGWNGVGLSINYRDYIWADYNFNVCTYLFTL